MKCPCCGNTDDEQLDFERAETLDGRDLGYWNCWCYACGVGYWTTDKNPMEQNHEDEL